MKKLYALLIALGVGAGLYLGGFGTYSDYPDPKLTPGDLAYERNAEYLKTHTTGEFRDVNAKKLKECFTRYGLKYPQPKGKFECDHFFPLCLQGSNDIKNLWPQPSPAFHDKDKVEAQLCNRFRKGEISLKESQDIIRHWRDYYEKNFKNRLGGMDSECNDTETGCP